MKFTTTSLININKFNYLNYFLIYTDLSIEKQLNSGFRPFNLSVLQADAKYHHHP